MLDFSLRAHWIRSQAAHTQSGAKHEEQYCGLGISVIPETPEVLVTRKVVSSVESTKLLIINAGFFFVVYG